MVNKFRGDIGLLTPGLDALRRATHRPVLGVLPWLPDVWMDAEDALAVGGWSSSRSTDGTTLRVAVIRFPRVSNATDIDALAMEPGVAVTVTADPDAVASADLVVLPGTRATVEELEWLRQRHRADVLTSRARSGLPVLGICGGHQMLATSIVDHIESRRGSVPGLGLLPTVVDFQHAKHLGITSGSWRGEAVAGYEIHHGVTTLSGDLPALDAQPFLDGWRLGAVWGTTWQGAFENDSFRRAWLTEAAIQAGVDWRPASGSPGFSETRNIMLDRLADAVEEHLDTRSLLRLIESGPPSSPTVHPSRLAVTVEAVSGVRTTAGRDRAARPRSRPGSR